MLPTEYLPVSFSQQSLRFLHRLASDGGLYNLPVAWEIKGALDEEALQQLASWKTTLAGAPALLDFPLDKPRPVHTSHRVRRSTSASIRPYWRACSGCAVSGRSSCSC